MHTKPIITKVNNKEEDDRREKTKTQQTRNYKGKKLEIETKRVGP